MHFPLEMNLTKL